MEQNKQLIVLVGPCGSGKSTLARQYREQGYTYVNQDSQGKGHLHIFDMAVLAGDKVIVDRMGFSKMQRSRYLDIAKQNGYTTKIIVLHQSYSVCFERMMVRKDHETIKNEESARSALSMFFSKYERVEDSEADEIVRVWPDGPKPSAIICDLDGTLCNIEHRRHFVLAKEGEKKDWKSFNSNIKDDVPNKWCVELLEGFNGKHTIVFCSGRMSDLRRDTYAWLKRYELNKFNNEQMYLYMRPRKDSRKDNIVKEIILDFEILTRFTPFFMIDDRQQVVDMWRSRGYTCLQCDRGDF